MQTKLLCIVIGVVCLLPLHAQTYFQEDFSTATTDQAPTGWTQDFGFSSGDELWRFDNPGLRVLPAPLEPPYAIFDSHYYSGFTNNPTISLISPNFSVAGADQLILTFDHQYYHGEYSNAAVEVYNGSEWVVVWDAMEQSVGYNSEHPFNILHESHQTVSEYIDITEALGNIPVAQVRFVYMGTFSNWWAVDNVAVFQPSTNDIKVVGLTQLEEWEKFEEQETLAVRLQNTGKQPINFNLQPAIVELNIFPDNGGMTQTYNLALNSGFLNVGQSKDFVVTATADLSQRTNYEIRLNLQWESDENTLNNEKILDRNNQKKTATLPIPTVTFTGFSNRGFANHSNLDEISPLWIEAQSRADNVPMHRYTYSSWLSSEYFASIPQHVNGNAPFFDFAGNSGLEDEKFWLVGPLIDATEQTEVRFDLALLAGGIGYAYSFPLDHDDEFVLAVSTDGGFHYEAVKVYDQSSEISHTGQTEYVSLAAYAGQEIKVAFYASYNTMDQAAKDPSVLFLDNIQIYNRSPIDIGILDIGNIRTLGCQGFTDAFPVVVRNFGQETLDFESRPLSLQIAIEGDNESHELTAEWSVGSLAIAETKELAIPLENMPILSSGNYNIRLVTDLAQDGNSVNDSLQFDKTVHSFKDLPLTYLDFTEMKEGHVSNIADTYPNWRASTGEEVPIRDNGTWRIATFGNKNDHPFGEAIYNEFRTTNPKGEWLLSPKFEVSENASLSYQMALVRDDTIFPDSIPEGSYVQVLVSTDCEASFSPLKTYDHTTPISNEGQLENIDLSAYTGQEVVLAFYIWQGILDDSGGDFINPRLFLDNIFVSDVPLQDVGIVDAIFPYSADRLCTMLPQEIKVVVGNQGTTTLENITVEMDLYESGTNQYILSTSKTLDVPLQANQTDTLILDVTVTETWGGHYGNIYTHIENDARVENDTLEEGMFFRRTFVFDFPEDTSACDSIVLEPDVPAISAEYLWSTFSMNPSITVYESGEYTLRVTDSHICPFRDTIDVIIYNESPTALFDITDLGEGTFQFTNLSTEAESFVWDFGDGESSEEAHPIHTYAENGNYTVNLKAVNPCGKIENSLVVAWVGIEDFSLEESASKLQVFPNPSEGLFELQLDRTLQGDWSVRVRNMQGALVYQDEKRQLTSGENGFRYLLDLRGWVKGVYLVEVWSEEGRWIRKIVKK